MKKLINWLFIQYEWLKPVRLPIAILIVYHKGTGGSIAWYGQFFYSQKQIDKFKRSPKVIGSQYELSVMYLTNKYAGG